MKIKENDGVEIQQLDRELQYMDITQIISKENILTDTSLMTIATAINSSCTTPVKKAKNPLKLETSAAKQTAPPIQPGPSRQMEMLSPLARDTAPETKMKEAFSIDKSYTGVVIGKGGANIQKITDDTATEINLTDGEMCGMKVKIVNITGTETNVNKAKRKIEDMIKGAMEKRLKKAYESTK